MEGPMPRFNLLTLLACFTAASGSTLTCGGDQYHGTQEGAPCQFPFTYKGNTYDHCITVDWTEPWCLTDPPEHHASNLATYTASWGNCECGSTGGDWAFTGAAVHQETDNGADLKKTANTGAWDSWAISTAQHVAISGKPGQTNDVLQFGLGDDREDDIDYKVQLQPDGVAKVMDVTGIWITLNDWMGAYSTDDEFAIAIEDHRIILLINGEEQYNWGSTVERHLHAKVRFWTPGARLNEVKFVYTEDESNRPLVKPGRFCWKDTYGRGIGTIPNRCPDDKVKIGALCYSHCPDGMHRWGFDCHSICPDGWSNHGLYCARESYGRGGGYPWEFGDSLNLSGARSRCEEDKGKGNCEQHGLIIYPKCRNGYQNVGCCLCEPKDISCGDYDLGGKVEWVGGTSCAKRIEIGDPEPMECPDGKEKQDGLCYTPCRDGYDGVGPVCWGGPPPGWVNCGMGAALNDYECADATGNQIWSVTEFALFVGTAGSSSSAMKASRVGKVTTAASKWSKMRVAMKQMIAKHPRLYKALSDGGELAHYGLTTAAIMNEDVVTEEDAVRLVASMATLVDPTGISSVIEAYTWPKCSKLLIDYPEPLEVPNRWVPTSDAYIDATFDEFTMTHQLLGTASELGMNTRSFTVSAWVMRAETVMIGSESDVSILGGFSKKFNEGLHLIVRNGKYYMGFYQNDCASDAFSTLNNWEQVTFRYDMLYYEMSIFLNGELVKTCDDKLPFAGTEGVYVGDSSQGEWSGQIKNIRIFRRALTNTEVQEVYDNEAGIGQITAKEPTLRMPTGRTNQQRSDWGGLRSDPTHWGWYDDDSLPLNMGNAQDVGLTGMQWTVSAWVIRGSSLDNAAFAILGTDSTDQNKGLNLLVKHSDTVDHQYHMGFWGPACTTSPTGDFDKNKKWDWRYVTFQYHYGYMRIWENGILLKECEDMDAFEGTGNLRIGQAQGTSTWQGGIRELKIWDYALDEQQILTEYSRLYPGIGFPYGTSEMAKGYHVANVKPSTEFEMSFLLEPTGLSDDWTSIVHFTTNREDCCDAGTRMPYISMRPDTTQLRILTSCGNPWNKSCNPPYDLPPNQITEVKMRVANSMILVWFNGHVVAECTCPDMTIPDDDWDAMVYLGDPWLDTPKAKIRSLTYVPLESREVVIDVVDRADETIVEDFDESVFEMYDEDHICVSPTLMFNYGSGELVLDGLTETQCKHMIGTAVGLGGADVVYAVFANSGLCYTYTEYVVHAGDAHVDLPVQAAWELCQAREAGFEMEHSGKCSGNALSESYENSLGECAETCLGNPDCDYFDYAEAYEELPYDGTACDNSFLIDLGDETWVDLDICKAKCKYNNCKYIYWQSAEDRSSTTPYCHLYTSCAVLRNPTFPGRFFRQTKFSGVDVGAGKTCSEGERILQASHDHDTCRTMCQDDSSCKFYYFQKAEERSANSPWCHLYRSCNALRTPSVGGSNYAKSSWAQYDNNTNCALFANSCSANTAFRGSHRAYRIDRTHEGETPSWHSSLAHENAHIEAAIEEEHTHLTELNQNHIDEIEAASASGRRREGSELKSPQPFRDFKLRPLM